MTFDASPCERALSESPLNLGFPPVCGGPKLPRDPSTLMWRYRRGMLPADGRDAATAWLNEAHAACTQIRFDLALDESRIKRTADEAARAGHMMVDVWLGSRRELSKS